MLSLPIIFILAIFPSHTVSYLPKRKSAFWGEQDPEIGPVEGAKGMSEAMEKAVERTKQWQSTDRDRRQKPAFTQTALKARATEPARVQALDVEKLNRMIKSIDRTWTMPREGSAEPVGSNFQYKKTCESLYRARQNACEQPGFGIMCFNYCFEQGERLEFRCEDASESQFCTSSASHDSVLAKYKRDPYRAKAYIHQQLTRCYASAVCHASLLNSTLVRAKSLRAPAVPLHLRALHARRERQRPPSDGMASTAVTRRKEQPIRVVPTLRKGKKALMGRRNRVMEEKKMKWDEEEGEDEDEGRKSSTKAVPYWQKLLVRKREEDGRGTVTGKRGGTVTMKTTTTVGSMGTVVGDTVSEDDDDEADEAEDEKEEREEERRWLEHRFGRRHKERQLLQMSPQGPPAPGFWKSFRPGKWFQSVHYITNTG